MTEYELVTISFDFHMVNRQQQNVMMRKSRKYSSRNIVQD